MHNNYCFKSPATLNKTGTIGRAAWEWSQLEWSSQRANYWKPWQNKAKQIQWKPHERVMEKPLRLRQARTRQRDAWTHGTQKKKPSETHPFYAASSKHKTKDTKHSAWNTLTVQNNAIHHESFWYHCGFGAPNVIRGYFLRRFLYFISLSKVWSCVTVFKRRNTYCLFFLFFYDQQFCVVPAQYRFFPL